MIEISPIYEKEKVNAFFEKVGIIKKENAGCVAAKTGEEILGFCLYEIYEKGITVLYIEPKDDLGLADGILRSTLHIAAERSAMDARYVGEENEALFCKLNFILDKKDKKLNIDKLFEGCHCHG